MVTARTVKEGEELGGGEKDSSPLSRGGGRGEKV